ncbi:GNAT superfamily N-acetyltransferase [Actinoplanes lutulentus]|uniref:Acetyltransferase (GNAT) family protein n=1 Tax=Actinoplanes lutulentus TaxID=1287878 RepID=A0A327ZM33_9ACTN|nr:GNAT family N-acetyltransferase [Actinoplanes lutulentus]MBB2941246.1 GNAT superfamily N-acetyltransferase [Actinoplanes lutulentus]RAK43555.1 acetyltransferase (GNAT) family protein [Actinoplanes lutulentus]
MSLPEISLATPAHRERVVSTLVAAFHDDPVLRHLFPQSYPEHAAAFFGHLFDKRVHQNSIWIVGEGASAGAAVAIWEPPALPGATPAPAPPISLPAPEMERMREYDESVHSALPKEPFWYLGVLGTHPDWTGRRWGHALMAEGLRRAAASGFPAVLETSKPGNVDMYRRAGWQVLAEITAPLPTWIMQQTR